MAEPQDTLQSFTSKESSGFVGKRLPAASVVISAHGTSVVAADLAGITIGAVMLTPAVGLVLRNKNLPIQSWYFFKSHMRNSPSKGSLTGEEPLQLVGGPPQATV